MSLPSGLQKFTFGNHFNQGLDKMSLPSGSQRPHIWIHFNHNLDNVISPKGLQQLILDNLMLVHSLARAALLPVGSCHVSQFSFDEVCCRNVTRASSMLDFESHGRRLASGRC